MFLHVFIFSLWEYRIFLIFCKLRTRVSHTCTNTEWTFPNGLCRLLCSYLRPRKEAILIPHYPQIVKCTPTWTTWSRSSIWIFSVGRGLQLPLSFFDHTSVCIPELWWELDGVLLGLWDLHRFQIGNIQIFSERLAYFYRIDPQCKTSPYHKDQCW